MVNAFRNISLISLLTIISFSGIKAQTIRPDENPIFNGEQKFSAGIAFGTNLSQVDGDGMSGFSKIGMNIGPLINVRFS